MRINKTERGWSIDVPDDVVETLGLRDGEDVDVDIRRARPVSAEMTGEEFLRKVKSFRGAFPVGFKFDRDEANARR